MLAKEQRRSALSAQDAAEFLEVLTSFDIAIDRAGADRILTDVHRLAVAYRLTGYDAAYLELALRMGLPLATLDAELREACRGAGGIAYSA